MKRTGQNAAPGENIPHQSDTADAEASDRRHVPGPDDRNVLDEDYGTDQAPLAPDSPLGGELHQRRPKAGGQLDVGTAGDAARPGKEGIDGKPIPPRGQL